jgi:SET domain-containing protein
MPYSNLLHRLKNQTKIILKSSPVHGIGVFALQKIPKGSRDFFFSDGGKWIKVPIQEVEKLPVHARELVETYCLFDEESYFVPEQGFNMIDPVIYLNHSSHPNIISVNEGEKFEALKDIEAGEELLLNYNEIVEGMEGYS